MHAVGVLLSSMHAHAGWRSRGYLPHCDAAGLTQHVVFGLADAFPDESDAPDTPTERIKWREAVLDRGLGSAVLRGDAGESVEQAMLYFDGLRYALCAWCVMPNHVHVVVTTDHGWPLSSIVHSWKSFSANQINKTLSRTGRLWRREYYDHYVRSDEEYRATVAYVENNPVAAGYVANANEWRYSSAWSGK